MSRANKIFSKIFEAEMPDLTNDEEAFNNALDLETDPAAFSTEPSAPGFDAKYIEKAKEWIGKIDKFVEWINGTENSLNKYFVDIDYDGSPFEGISSSSSKMLTRIAGDLADLQQHISGYIITYGKKDSESANESVKKKVIESTIPQSDETLRRKFWLWLKNKYGSKWRFVTVKSEHLDEYNQLDNPEYPKLGEAEINHIQQRFVGKKLKDVLQPPRKIERDYGDFPGDDERRSWRQGIGGDYARHGAQQMKHWGY